MRTSLMQSQVDQENLLVKISNWKIAQPNDNFFFRPYCENSNATFVTESEDVQVIGSAGTGLLFVHQTVWQKQLLSKYGYICMLDATYKTTRYALPLFFLCVRTNVDYVVVATFVIQSEDSASIAEALKLIKQWNNSSWRPNAFMVDCSEAEIGALTTVFSGYFIIIFIMRVGVEGSYL